jgi:hypothetical protein
MAFETPAVVHISDLNTVLCLNKLVPDISGFMEHLKSHKVNYIKHLTPSFEQVIMAINKNPNLTFFKSTPNQQVSFPAQCTYFLPLLSAHPYNDQEMN